MSDWFSRQRKKRGRETLPDLTALWRKMDLQEAWDPPPPRYKLDLKASTRSNERSGEAPRYLAHPGATGAAKIDPPTPQRWRGDKNPGWWRG